MSVSALSSNALGNSVKPEVTFWKCAAEIAEAEDTPFYVYFPERASAAYQIFASSIQIWGKSQVAFSVKTNPLWRLLRDLNQWGSYAEVVSTWEFSHAIAAGFPPERIVVNGPLKTDDDLRWLCRQRPATINIDSSDELETLERVAADSGSRVHVGLRMCPPKENGAWSRFGIEVDSGEFDGAVARVLTSPALMLRCIHFHLGTQVQDTSRYTVMIQKVKDVWRRHALKKDVWLDIGGGFPYDHSVPFEEQSFSLPNLVSTLADAWGPPPRPRLFAEPGRFIAAPAMAVVTKVLALKPRSGEPTIVVLDSGTNHNVMAAFYEHLWRYSETTDSTCHRLCGPLCMEDDILGGVKRSAAPKKGSLVASFNAGAYSLSLSRAFIQPRPPVVEMRNDRSYQLLQPREKIDQSYAFARDFPEEINCQERSL